MTETVGYYSYWGKAKPEGESGPAYHLLPYHCLDVAVTDQWWKNTSGLRQQFKQFTQLDTEENAYACLMFFTASIIKKSSPRTASWNNSPILKTYSTPNAPTSTTWKNAG
ncbi:MAG: HD domain-containing protein [Methylicorpusculum sp.]|nr:HD domain-containing protein [Methylicorpusculum sp.]